MKSKDSASAKSASDVAVPDTPLPVAQLWVAAFVQITEGMNTNILFPFMAFMTEDFGYTGHRLGIYAGTTDYIFYFCYNIDKYLLYS